jgi:peptidyl-prolyl cis-trans isomerase SurA
MKKIFYFVFFLIFPNISVASIESRIIANVGSEIITSYELKNKIKTTLVLNNQKMSQQNINNSKTQAIQQLVIYKLKKNETKKYNISGNKQSVTNYLNDIATKYKTDLMGFKDSFTLNNINFDLYLEEIKTEFAWQKLIFDLYKDKINLDEKEIEKELNEMIAKEQKINEYKLLEIAFILEDYSKKDSKVKEIQDQINLIGFENTAKKFSMSSSAINGGDLGWINSKSMSKKILDVVKYMKVGEVSKPLFQSDNLMFLKLDNKKISTINNFNIEKLRSDIITKKKNYSLDLYSNSHLSKIKNKTFIKFK